MPSLLEREAQVGDAQLEQLSGHPQTVQAQLRVVSRRDEDAQVSRATCDQLLQLSHCIARRQLVQVVDDQQQLGIDALESGDQSGDERPAVEVGRGLEHWYLSPWLSRRA